ncbi:MAG: cell division protein ZapA [Bacteroidota bacterium]|nr:cell division protein ZapA [Bacteroidota bacterium]
MSELIAISALIGDRTYRIKISPDDEEIVRKTLKTINDKIVEFKTLFAGKDMQDYVAMVLIWYATEQTKGGIATIEKENFLERLISIETLLDNQLKEK